MFDDDESTVDGDISSSPIEESDAYGDFEVVNPNPDEESLSHTDHVKEVSSFHNMEFQFSEDEFEFSDEEFKAPISPSPSELQESYQCLDPFSDSEETSFLLDPEQSKDFHIEGIDTPHEYYMLEQDVKNVCSMAANSMSGTEVNDENESSFLEEPQDTYSSEETPSHPAISTHAESNHPLPLYQKKFKRVVVDDFVYHKYCKSRCGVLYKSCS